MFPDVPTIISGERVAYLDPQEEIWPGESGKLFRLANLQGSDALAPFNGIADFRSQEMTSYPKTLFRFPLRSATSALSENIYNTQKLQKLTDALREEAKYLLLFLRSVDKVEVYNISQGEFHTLSFRVQIASQNQREVGQKRSTFMDQLHDAHKSQPYGITEMISFTAKFEIEVTDNYSNQSGSSSWLVANCIGSRESTVIAAAKKQHVFPWVGTSLELPKTQEAPTPPGGRIYCFLPLPIEASSKFPVNVNGTFSLNDERRTLKWPGRERTNDPMAEWNKLLVTELLPPCYALLLEEAKKYLQPDQFYNAWPDVRSVRGSEWEVTVNPLLNIIFSKACVWTSTALEWITVQQATFIPKSTVLLDVVKRVLTICKVKLVNISERAWNALDYQDRSESVKLVSPKIVRQEMRAKLDSYSNELINSRLELLDYCLSDRIFTDLHGLQLLPLANNTFVAFLNSRMSRSSIARYLCSRQYPHHLLPNISHLLVDVKDESLQHQLQRVASSGDTQLQVLSIQNVAKLLPSCFPHEWARSQTVSLPSSSFPSDWFQTFWNWVRQHDLSYFANQLVVPLAVRDTRHGFKVTRLVPSLSSAVVYISEDCSPDLLNALTKLQVQCTIYKHVDYLWHNQLYSYLNRQNPSGVLTAIGNAGQYTNSSLSSREASEFQTFLASRMSDVLSTTQQNVLKNLALFTSVNKQGLYSSIQASNDSWGNKAIKEPPGVSIPASSLPANLIVLSSDNQTTLLQLCSPLVTMPSTLLNFVLDIIFPMIKSSSFPEKQLDSFMVQVLQLFLILKQQDSSLRHWNSPSTLITELSSLPFLKTAPFSHQRKTPESLFDPSNQELKEMYQGEAVFPVEPFNQEQYLPRLRDCKLRVSVTAQEVISILSEVSSIPSNVPQKATNVQITRIKAALSYICTHGSILSQIVNVPTCMLTYSGFHQAFQELSTKRSFLPVLSSHPENYQHCLVWKGADFNSHVISHGNLVLLCTKEEMDTLAHIVGSEMYVVECPSKLRSLFSFEIPINPVFTHFQHVIEHKNSMDTEHLNAIVHKIYTFLSDNCNRLMRAVHPIFDLHSSDWIWIHNRNMFVSPKHVVLQQHDSFEYSLQPYIYQLPEDLQKYSSLFTSFGVRKQLTNSQIIGTLQMIKEDKSESVPAQQAWRMVEHILNWLTDGGDSLASCRLKANEQLYVPIESTSECPQLVEVEKVVYTDLDFLKSFHLSAEETITFIHHKVAHLAKSLKVKPLSTHLNLSEDAFGDVGQHEPLVTRLKNILRDYKDGLTIIKELLQNADDAEATELNICYDARTHITKPEELIFSGMSDCHGPALIIHNNAVFKDEDFENITKLAGATKLNKSLKIGKFGVGFCSVYHITDVPSFISRDWLYIFDPTITYLKKEIYDRARPGKRLRFTEKLVSHSKQVKPYLNLFGFQQDKPYQGTIFRFPFRTSTSDISGLRYNDTHVDQLLSDVQQSGSRLLLFLKSIKRITFSKLTDGNSEPEIMLDIRKDSLAMVLSDSESHADHEQSTHVQTQQVEICACSNKQTEKWLVSTHTTQLEFCNDIKYATASVACSLNTTDCTSNTTCHSPETVTGEVFCFLPLSLQTGLPVHVSSNFAVLNDRTGIHSSDSLQTAGQNEVQWNVHLMEVVIPEAYLSLLLALQQLCQQGTVSVEEYQFYLLWPLKELIKTHNPWDKLLPSLYTLISSNGLFYSTCTKQWIELSAAKILSTDILCHIKTQESTTPQCVIDVVESLQYPLVKIPPTIVNQFPQYEIEHCIISEEEFLKIFFESINNLSMYTRNDVLFSLMQAYVVCTVTQKVYMDKYVINNPCIPCTPDGSQLKSCSEIVDPCNEFSKLFEPEDGVFPLNRFHSNDVIHTALVQLGMICDKLHWSMLIERASTVEDLVVTQNSLEKAMKRVSLILKCIDRNLQRYYYSHNTKLPTEASQLKTIVFIPVMEASKSYPAQLQWRGEGQKLARSEHVMKDNGNIYLVGSQVSIACESIPTKGGCGTIPSNVSTALGIRSKPSCVDVVKHLCHIVEECPPSKSEVKWIGEACDQIYRYLEQELSLQEVNDSDLEPLNCINCIWTGTDFISIHSIATNWNHDGPYLYMLPHLLKSKPNLERALCIQKDFDVEQLLTALKTMSDDFDGKQVGNREKKFIPDIADELESQLDEFGLHEDQMCYLPDEDYYMQNTHNLAYNDAPWCAMDQDCRFVHHRINRETAIRLGVKPVRSKALERYESATHHFDGVPFGQREELTQRIKNILSEYPCDITVIKELLQNADDAKATKMYIILDERKHGTHKLPSSEWKDLQGPALLVWNDKGFSEADLKGIQKLGLGSKRKESESIGQYGIGFNVVYHLTDCPSFFTNGSTLCVLDPHCRYVPGANKSKPGRQYNDLDDKFWNNWTDLKTAYLREGIIGCPEEVQTHGTLFRFPLRHNQPLVDQSELTNKEDLRFGISNTPIFSWKLKESLTEWAPKMKEALIFLKHVTELKFFFIQDKRNSLQFSLTHHYKVNLDQSALYSRKHIAEKAAMFTESNNEPLRVTYPLSLCEEAPHSEVEQWLIQQGVGDMDKQEQHWKFVPQVKPQHGIAAQIRGHKFKGSVFCFLPLPVQSHLPIHVNGAFILDAARSGLWQSRDPHDPDDKQKWNYRLIEAIASSYANFLVNCQNAYISQHQYENQRDMWSAIERYYNVFPKWEHKEPPEREMMSLSKFVYQKLGEHNAKIIVSIEKVECDEHSMEPSRSVRLASSSRRSGKSNTQFQAEWLHLKDSDNPSKQAYFWKESSEAKGMAPILKRIGMKLTAAPMWIKDHFSEVELELPQAIPDTVFEYFCRFYHQISHNSTFPCHIKDTSFLNPNDFLTFTEFIVKQVHHEDYGTHREFPDPGLFDFPLLLTADEQLRVFSQDSKVIVSNYSYLFKKSSDKFLHPDMIKVKYDPSYFVVPSEESRQLVHAIVEVELPQSLCKKRVYKANEHINIPQFLQPLWQCFFNESVFSTHLKSILEQWALILSKRNQLFSCNVPEEQLLPAIPPTRSSYQSTQFSAFSIRTDEHLVLNQEMNEVMAQCGMPILEISVSIPLLCKQFCPQFSQPERILANLFFLDQNGELIRGNVFENNLKKVFTYFSRIHFGADKVSLFRVKSLPMFKDIDNKLCRITGETFIWPRYVCESGRAKWLEKTATVFLKSNGIWRLLGDHSLLEINYISPLILYVKYIFPYFHLFSEDERHQQLLHIRDTSQLFDTALHDSELEDDESGRKKEGELFVTALKHLPCLMKDGDLKPLSDFCDPDIDVFETFRESFVFPPSRYSDKKWLKFFRKIGLRQKATQEEFITFCNDVSSGRHKKLMFASRILLNYLFNESDWHDHFLFLSKVSQIAFVCAEPLKQLSWILPVILSENKIIKGKQTIRLTSLRQAALHKHCKLLWTVMPIVTLPTLNLTPVKEIEKFHRSLGVCTAPSCSQVVRNILNISNSRFSNFNLFDKYSEDCQLHKGNDELLKVLLENFQYFDKHEHSQHDVASLKTVSCIPVSNNGATTDVSSPVLVTPLQVIASDSHEVKQLLPFVNPLPHELFSVKPGILSSIGVTSDIHLSHVKFALETIHTHVQSKLDPNTIEVVKNLLKKLYNLLKHPLSGTSFDDDKLYLPNKKHELVHCKQLLYNDKDYCDSEFDFSQVPYSVLSLLTRKFDELDELGFQTKQFFQILPQNVRPIPFSSACRETLHTSCKPQEEQSELGTKLKKCFELTEFGHCAQLILEQASSKKEICAKFGQSLEEFSKSVQVITVSNLKVDVHLELVSPPYKLGTAKVDFLLQQSTADYSLLHLYIDDKANPLTSFNLLESLTHAIVSHVAQTAEIDLSCLNQPEKAVEKMLQVSKPEDLRLVLDSLGINTARLNLSSTLNVDLTPKLGAAIPEEWHHRLQADINNVFRPQEWVGFEERDNYFIFAQVQYQVNPELQQKESDSDDEHIELPIFRILTQEDDEEGKDVSIIDLHKILRIRQVTKDDGSTELVLYDSESESVRLWDAVKDDKLKVIMREICAELRRIWKIKDRDQKRKAIKAMFLKWHPDKNDSPFATKAFQFLQRQINRLEQGLPLEDPEEEWESTPEPPRNSYWDNLFNVWSNTARRHGSSWRREQTYCSRGGSGGGGGLWYGSGWGWESSIRVTPEQEKAKVWLKQAECDLTALRFILTQTDSTQVVSAHVCFLAHQVAEKALKAGMYKRFGLHPSALKTHALTGHASALEGPLNPGLHTLASSLESYYLRTRYPNLYTPDSVPSDKYGPSEAKRAENTVSRIFEMMRGIVVGEDIIT